MQKAYINNNILIWARESANMQIDVAAKKIPCKEETLQSWELGDDYPSVNQAEKLAKLYNRPLAVFYLPFPPKDFQTLRDFRRQGNANYSTSLIFIIREIQQKQNWLKEFFQDIGAEKLPFIGKYSLSDSINEIAKDIRETIGINNYLGVNNILKHWIEKIEQKRIFISQTSSLHSYMKLEVDEVRGFTIADKIAPFIFINSRDADTANLFTLLHELAHLWINASGVSNISNIDFRENQSNLFDPVEIFCNKIAAEALMPELEIKAIIKTKPSQDELKKIAKQFGVSKIALSTRLVNLKIISNDYYETIKSQYYDESMFYELNKKQQTGAPDWYLLRLRRNGRNFSNIVISNYKNGQITGTDASSLLGVKINNFSKYENQLYKI